MLVFKIVPPEMIKQSDSNMGTTDLSKVGKLAILIHIRTPTSRVELVTQQVKVKAISDKQHSDIKNLLNLDLVNLFQNPRCKMKL